MKLSTSAKILALALLAYIACDILLTPAARLETRPIGGVTGLGLATLSLLFAGLALAIVALVLWFRRSRRTSIVAIIAALLYLPAPLAEVTGNFSVFRPPTAIAWLEALQALVALIVVITGVRTLRDGLGETNS